MDHQTAINTVAAHLRRQGRPARSADGRGCVRDSSGAVDAVGALIGDNYTPAMEQADLYGLYALEVGLEDLSFGLVHSLQCLHDDPRAWDPDGFTPWGERRLERVAHEYRLHYPRPSVLDTLGRY